MRYFCLILCLGVFPLSGFAQSVTVRGEVQEGETGTPLPGVNVYLEETGQGGASGPDGHFEIRGVRPGDYTLVATLLGYEILRQPLVVSAEAPAALTLVMTPQPIDLGEVLAQADRAYSAASSQTIRAFDLLTRPTRSAQDLLRLTPGLVIAQHAGGGKAEQIFLRGFDADHGTDVALFVDGMPVNMVSHGHGQGYADLHFVIPDVVESIGVYKGPYEARFGNLATAGAVTLQTRDHLDHNLVRLEGGAFNTFGLTTRYQIPLGGLHQGAYLAGQFYNTDGPFERPQGFQRFNLFGKFHTHLSEDATLALSVDGFSSAWDASGQVPQRAVDDGHIGRFGSIDDLEGGTTGRQNVNLSYEAAYGSTRFSLQGYASRYTFKLFSNFTFFLEDAANGDMIEQTDDRRLFGFNGRYQHTYGFGPGLATTTLGSGFRSDDVSVGLWHSPGRVRLEGLVDADLTERNLFLWGQQEFILTPQVRLQLGVRGDYFTYDVNDRLEGAPADLPHASGYAQEAILSPKASLVVSPTRRLDLFANIGSGFHSNDARDVVLGRRVADRVRVLQRQGLSAGEIEARLEADHYDPDHQNIGTLPRAVGGELGVRARPLRRLNVAAAAWWLDLDREFVYVGDGGFTELSGRSRRYGLDLEARLSITAWLSADADVNLSRGAFLDEPEGTDAIPLAPRLTSTGGLTALHPKGFEGSLRYIHVGARPANEARSVTAEGYTVVTIAAAYRLGAVNVHLTVENLLDAVWNEAQFDTESRLPGEAASVSELHFTPGNPRNLRLGIAYLF